MVDAPRTADDNKNKTPTPDAPPSPLPPGGLSPGTTGGATTSPAAARCTGSPPSAYGSPPPALASPQAPIPTSGGAPPPHRPAPSPNPGQPPLAEGDEIVGGNPKLVRPCGRDFIMDYSVPGFPSVLKEGRRFTSVDGDVFNTTGTYGIFRLLGKGTYCTVAGAIDGDRKQAVAIKKCGFVFARTLDGKRLLREVKMQLAFHHPNIVGLLDILVPQEGRAFTDLYFVLESMDTDLYHYQASKPLPESEVKGYSYAVLKALHYLHTCNIAHRDMKPDNILLSSETGVAKLCDFNLARGCGGSINLSGEPMTTSLATIMYRSPEVLLGNKHYSTKVDVWSMGCVFAEMLTGSSLFPGKTQIDMMQRIVGALSLRAKDEDLSWIEDVSLRQVMLGFILQSDSDKGLLDLLPPHLSPKAVNLLSRMLTLDPRKRPTALEILQDEYFDGLYKEEECKASPWRFQWSLDDSTLTEAQMRELFWAEIVKLHPPQPKQGPKATPSEGAQGGDPVSPASRDSPATHPQGA